MIWICPPLEAVKANPDQKIFPVHVHLSAFILKV